MKIFMTAVMMMVMTSAMAGDCKLGGDCKVEADCKALSGAFANGKCIDPKANEKETQCAGIVGTAGAKPSADSAADAAAAGSKALQK